MIKKKTDVYVKSPNGRWKKVNSIESRLTKSKYYEDLTKELVSSDLYGQRMSLRYGTIDDSANGRLNGYKKYAYNGNKSYRFDVSYSYGRRK